jgi:hypothetical protein
MEITEFQGKLIKRFQAVKNMFTILKPNSVIQDIHLEYPLELKSRWGFGQPVHPRLNEIIEKRRAFYRYFLFDIEDLEAFKYFKWNNGWFNGIDVITLYRMLRLEDFKRFIEVGSGITTMIARQSIVDNGLQTKILTIDPFPERVPQGVADEFRKERFENIDPEFFKTVGEGDILFVDNSHYCLQNSDATVMFTEALQNIQVGAVVHFHDIFLPYDYPPEFHYRVFTEQYPLACWLLAGDKFEVIMPNMFVSLDEELSALYEPFVTRYNPVGFEPCGASFYIQKVKE